MNSINNIFSRYCKAIANLLIWVIGECLTCLSIMVVSPFKKIWWWRCCRYIDIVKTLQTFYFGNFGNACPSPSKIIVSIWRRLSCLSGCKKSTSLYFFLEIFQINSQLAILGNLGMPGCTYIVSIWKNLLCLSTG